MGKSAETPTSVSEDAVSNRYGAAGVVGYGHQHISDRARVQRSHNRIYVTAAQEQNKHGRI